MTSFSSRRSTFPKGVRWPAPGGRGEYLYSLPDSRLAMILPTITVLLGSMVPLLPLVALWPELPPMGFMMLIVWRMLRTDVWPVWAALPLGLFDDLFSGQPIGSAMALWPVALIVMDMLDRRYIFRTAWRDWLVAALFLLAYLWGSLMIADAAATPTAPLILGPQLIISVLIYPMVARMCLWLQRRFRRP